MEIQRDALLRIVKATRSAMTLAETMQKLMSGTGQYTIADDISGFLQDALYKISGEQLSVGRNYVEDSTTHRLLTGDMCDEAVTDWFIMMDKIRNRIAVDGTIQPRPNTISRDNFRELFRKNGGYMVVEADRPK